jgi:lipopolysaccharide transport system ATP-binding protein
MSDTIIQVENLGKKYLLRHQGKESYVAFRDIITAKAVSIGRRLLNHGSRPYGDQTREEFWALREVSFEVKRGEVVGIIGRNGAGKSTLLKILSRITAPTTGKIRIKGRVASLLEIGTGFHPELTGRENIFLNGAILGMRRAEIQRNFDEIVAFAEVEKFLDTPVKRYSSGMYVRLAFAVAAHLEPEIMVVDEVLAVGDAAFQNKCLGKMGAAANEGRTVLFVSHNMAAINRLCEKCILIDGARIKKIGITESVVSYYLSQGKSDAGIVKLEVGAQDIAVINEVGIIDYRGHFSSNIGADKEFAFWVKYTINKILNSGQVAIAVISIDGNTVFVSTNTDSGKIGHHILLPGTYKAKVRVPANFLNIGTYSINVRILGRLEGETKCSHAIAFQAITFKVEETGSIASKLSDRRRGVVTPTLEWKFI